jgi:hypothetical protein
MRRSVALEVVVHCPHFGRPVTATRNLAIDRLVACSDAGLCREPAPAADRPGDEARDGDRPYPRGCPVFPSLAK